MRTLTRDEMRAALEADTEAQEVPGYDRVAWWAERGIDMDYVAKYSAHVYRVWEELNLEPTVAQASEFMFMAGARFGLVLAEQRDSVTS